MRLRISRSLSVSASSGFPLPAAAQQLANDLGIDDAFADAHPAQRVADRGRVVDAVLEQVAGSGRMIFEQGLGVAGFQVAG